LPPDPKLKCSKFDFGRGSTPQTPLEELTALSQAPQLDFRESCFKREGREAKTGGQVTEKIG